MNALTHRATSHRDTFGGWLVLLALAALAGLTAYAAIAPALS